MAINRPGDEYEQEADGLSDRVTRMDVPKPLQAPGVEATLANFRAEPNASRKSVQTQRIHGGGAGLLAAPSSVREVLGGAGRPLDLGVRAYMEPRFASDFSQVRVHDDAGAALTAESINARAYTSGSHLVFGAGEYRPATPDGRRLLAHELTHVVQQGASAPLGGAFIQRDAPKEDPKVTALKTELVNTFGFSSVTDTNDARWSAPQLEKMKRALARIPAAERNAIKGVELRRVVTTSEFGTVASGLFKQEMGAGTGIRQDRIEIANQAFDNDKDSDEGSAHTNFFGQNVQGAPSEGVISHEVGHAIEAFPNRQAEELRIKADITDAASFAALKAASDSYSAAVLTRIDVPSWHNPKEKGYMDAIINAQKKLAAISDAMDKIPNPPSSAQSKRGAGDVKTALNSAKTAVAARNAARKALPKDSTYGMDPEESAQDAWVTAASALIPALEGRADPQKEAENAQAAEDATQVTVKVSSGNKVRMTRRLAEFVAVIESNNVDISKSTLGNHVISNWPDNPAEAYAELYNFSLTAPDGLKKFDKKGAVADYFTSPVGLKSGQAAQAASWLAKNK